MSWTIPRIHTLGNTALLSHFTHELARHPAQPAIPEIVKLLSNETEFTQFRNSNSTLTHNIYNAMGNKSTRSVQLMSAFQPPVYGNGDLVHIKNLVIDCEHTRLKDLKKYKKCLDNSSNVVLLDGDRAAMRHLISTVFKDDSEHERPNLYQCLTDFRVWKEKERFSSNVFGFGSLKIGRVPRSYEDPEQELKVQDVDLLKLISQSTRLNPTFLSYHEFKHLQYEHLIVKSTISTFTTLFDCTNGELLNMRIHVPLSKYVNECVKIILASDPKLNAETSALTAGVFNVERLLSVVYQVLRTTEHQSSVMRKQFQAYNNSGLFYNSAYFCRLARENHIKYCLYNTLYNQLLSAKISAKSDRADHEISSIL
ncbi:hypothetical protein WICPIJ_001261 [Wickerhamomyces pijperi]|uniref:Ketopantoate reductase C-terminal domain-containing protein n=1 Tax=Wickerhamomyces pijperi TaxID=599730 RepID=A0A9P8TQY7_WICPI|nr:hypothetical protein WICPIJ_001261 [Wickerhamomyces pijperi]